MAAPRPRPPPETMAIRAIRIAPPRCPPRSGRNNSPMYVARAQRCRGSGSNGPRDAEGVAGTSACALSKRLKGVRPATARRSASASQDIGELLRPASPIPSRSLRRPCEQPIQSLLEPAERLSLERPEGRARAPASRQAPAGPSPPWSPDRASGPSRREQLGEGKPGPLQATRPRASARPGWRARGSGIPGPSTLGKQSMSPSAPARAAATPKTEDGPQKTRIRSPARSRVSWKLVQSPLLSLMATTRSRSARRSASSGRIAFPALPGML